MKEVAENLKVSDQPIMKTIYEEGDTTVIAIGLGRGVELAEHLAPCKAKLMVVQGEIDFNTETESRRYACFESYDIPMNLRHSLVAWGDALVILFLTEG
jgi:quercetin dioxygenase-like cupin family protein